MTPKRLVLLVEGDGDVAAAPILLKRLLAEHNAFDVVFLDPRPLRVGEYGKISKHAFREWRRFLGAAAKRKDLGACLLLLDGDGRALVEGQPFCAMRAARRLAHEAQKVGGGTLFSVAIVFACVEFESWLIAGATSLQGKRFADGRLELPAKIEPPDLRNLEASPRDAKGWFHRIMNTGYKPARDQAELTRLVDLNVVRQQGMRSFRPLESAIRQLVEAVRLGAPTVNPSAQG